MLKEEVLRVSRGEWDRARWLDLAGGCVGEMRLDVDLDFLLFRHVEKIKGCILKMAPQAKISLNFI